MNKATTSVKSTRTKKTVQEPVVQEAVVQETVVQETVVQEPVVEVPVTQELTFKERLDVLIKNRMDHIDLLRKEVQELKKLQKEHDNILKEATKKPKKVKQPRDYSKPKKATGFAEPVIVSDELYKFLVTNKATMKDHSYVPSNEDEAKNWPRLPVKAGVPVARTDVTSFISKYIKDHNLQNPEMKREILPNAALKKIFNNSAEPEHSTFSYLKLQKYISHHFPKRVSKTDA